MTPQSFEKKWSEINHHPDEHPNVDESVLFVSPGKYPVTQRQLNLYYYFLFIKDVFNKISVKKVLEIGCGRGTLSLYLSRYLGLEVSLLDSAQDAIEITQREFASAQQKANFYVADALDTHLESETFDALISIGLAEHIDDVKTLFSEQYRLLKKGGVMVSLNIPKKFSIQYLNQVYRFIRKLLGLYKEDVRKDYYRNSLQADDYKRIAQEIGFQNISVTHVCPFPVYVPLSLKWDKRVTKVRKIILLVLSKFLKYPYVALPSLAQAHFLVAYKK